MVLFIKAVEEALPNISQKASLCHDFSPEKLVLLYLLEKV